MKKYLITGFAGFVSYYFLRHLDETSIEKIEVLGLDLNKPANFESDYDFKNLNIRFISVNLLDYNSLEIAITAFCPDYILHLAAFSSVGASWKKPVDSFMNNTNIFLNLVDAVRKNNVKCRILSVGSSEEYGNVSKNEIPLSENKILNPLSPYAIARVSQEMLSKCYVDSFNQDIIMTRSFNHIGPRQKDIFVIPSFVKQMVSGKKAGLRKIKLIVGDTSIVRDFTDVRDVVKAYKLLLEDGKSGELYNVCSGEGYSLDSIIKIISEKLDVEVLIEVNPDFIRPNDNMIIIGDNHKIKENIGWGPQYKIDETIDDMIDYFMNVN